MGPNGLRIANGHPMSYTVIMPTDIANTYGQRSFQIIQADFQKIGVQLTEKVLDDSAAYDAILANHYRNFELSMWDWGPLLDPDFMLSVLTCGSWNVWNDTGYCNKTYDSLYQAQSAATEPGQTAADRLPDAADGRERRGCTWWSTTRTRSRRTRPPGPTCRWWRIRRSRRCPRSRSRACTRSG